MSKKQSVSNKDIAEEVKKIISNVQAMEPELNRGLVNLKKTYSRGQCSGIREWQGQGLDTPQYLRTYCEKGSAYLKNSIIQPLLIHLLDYRDLLLGNKAYTAEGYKTLMKALLSAIHRYVVIADHFARFPTNLVPELDPTSAKYRAEIKKAIIENNRLLMGCDDGAKFPIQDIARNMGMTGDHAKILSYLSAS